MSVARFIADQRTEHQVPHALSCRVLGVSASWFYKWHNRPATARQVRRTELDAAVKQVFEASKGTYGSPRVHAELLGPAAGRQRLQRAAASKGVEGVGEHRRGQHAPRGRRTPTAGGSRTRALHVGGGCSFSECALTSGASTTITSGVRPVASASGACCPASAHTPDLPGRARRTVPHAQHGR